MTDTVERAFLAALSANLDRPDGLSGTLDASEEALDAYVAGFEQAARCIAREFDRPALVAAWIGD